MFEIAGGILLAIGALFLGAFLLGNWRALGYGICALFLVVILAAGLAP